LKILQLLILGALICLIVPVGSGDSPSASLSVGPGTPGTPPQNASAYISQAKAAAVGWNWTGVLLITMRGLAYYPDNADLLCIQGYGYRKMGQYAQSVDAVSKGILLDPRPVRYASRGYGYLALGNYSAALADAETGIALNASYPATYAVKALALKGMGTNSGALAAIEQALALDPGNAHYWHVKGMLLAAGGNCTGSRDALERSLDIDPDYTLPWPGFPGADESLAALNATCTPATQSPSYPSTKSPVSGTIAVIGVIGAVVAIGMRK